MKKAPHLRGNFFIYQSFIKFLPEIGQKDYVVIGWTHPNRKTWIYDDKNPQHQQIKTNSFIYKSKHHVFFRYDGTHRPKQILNKPIDSGIGFFDSWFNNYFNEYEQRLIMQAFYHDVNSRKLKITNFFFSKESLIDTDIIGNLFALDFVIDNKLFINPNNLHFNNDGHEKWAELISKEILSTDG
jgi:hypothetical protein